MLWSRISNGANSNYHYVTRKNGHLYAGACIWITWHDVCWLLPIGMAMFGPLADILPLQWIMVGSGIALIVIAGIAYYSRELKTI